MPKIIGIIPARYQSSRFPGKPLALIGNKSMIEWTYFHSMKSNVLSDLYVATDDERIHSTVIGFGGKSILTSSEHNSGTDRMIEACQKIGDADIIVNIQGDEPGISPDLISGVVNLKLQHPDWEMTTAAKELKNPLEIQDPNRVKIVFDRQQKALYFSRSIIPSNLKGNSPVFKHLGIYCYNRESLLSYNKLPYSNLEASESLEQLRGLQAGYRIGVFLYTSSLEISSVDVPEDLKNVIQEFTKLGWI